MDRLSSNPFSASPHFLEQYGAKGKCEKDIPDDELSERIYSAIGFQDLFDLRSYSEIELKRAEKNLPVYLLRFNQGRPVLDAIYYVFNKNVSFFQRIKEKYNFYRGEPFKAVDARVEQILNQQVAVQKEFEEQRLDSENPVQDRRNRCFRLLAMEKERINLNLAVKASVKAYNEVLKKGYSIIERVAFAVASFFHSFFKPAHAIGQLNLDTPVTRAADFNKAVYVGETTIRFQGEDIPVTVSSYFDLTSDFSGRTFFELKSEDGKYLGRVGIERAWRYSNHNYLALENSLGNFQNLKNRHLRIQYFEDKLRQDPVTGDRPVLRALTQIAVEVFSRENENKLVIGSHHSDDDVLYACGFVSDSKEESKVQKILSELEVSRASGKLFPPTKDRDHGSHDMYLFKTSSPLHSTQFVTLEKDGQEKSATVSVDLKAQPQSWEARIHSQPILKRKGLLLPQFLKRNLFRLEA